VRGDGVCGNGNGILVLRTAAVGPRDFILGVFVSFLRLKGPFGGRPLLRQKRVGLWLARGF
jgi:hypothetical protein